MERWSRPERAEAGDGFVVKDDLATTMWQQDVAVQAVDLFLDALTRPDQRTYRVCDVDELAQALAGGQISARRARAGPAPPTRAPSDLATAMTRAKASSQPSASAASRAHRPGHPVRGRSSGTHLIPLISYRDESLCISRTLAVARAL
jgi:hypothetical protein